jgi:hypothetical protein
MRCTRGSRIGTAKVGRCGHTGRLCVRTLVSTRGQAFPLALLQSRLKCPECGSREVYLIFSPPTGGVAAMAPAERRRESR